MIAWLRRFLDPAYLYSLNLGPLGRWGAVYVAWAALLLAGLGIGARWWRVAAEWGGRSHRSAKQTGRSGGILILPAGLIPLATARIVALACAVGLFALLLRILAPRLVELALVRSLSPAARLLLLEAWTARVWPLSATLVALAAPALYLLARRSLPHALECHVDALLGQRSERGLSGLQAAFLAGLHLAGLASLWSLGGHAVWWAAPSLLGLALLSALPRPRRLRLETLAPLFPAYLSALASVLFARWLNVDVTEYRAYLLPDPWSPWFYVEAMTGAGLAYTLWIQVRAILLDRLPGQRRRASHLGWVLARGLPLALGVGIGLWLLATVVIHRTHGVTASDPYCYVQMAIDLAEQGTPQHTFPLAGRARELGLPTWPTVHVGYHPPGPDNRAPTMWPIGWPLILAPFYRLGGLQALYWAAPLMGVLALVATALLVDEALRVASRRDVSRGVRWSVAALCCALVATSPEGSERLLVPMADAAAQLFSVLTLWLLLRGGRARPVLHGALAGVCFAVAYWVRHPLLPLGAAAVSAALSSSLSRARRVCDARWALLIPFALAALIVALPDLVYHKVAYGGWLVSESSEWFLISARNTGRALSGVLQEGLLRREETGYLAPLILYGAWLLWRRHRRAAWVLGTGFLAVFAFHLLYEALRPRDLIAILPLLYFPAAYGWVNAWRRLCWRKTLGGAVLLFCLLVALFARSYQVLALPWRTGVTTFGHVPASQAREFVRLGGRTPENAVVGSMLNSGAIELHARRAAVHPTPWTDQELYAWTDALLDEGRPFYVLDDGEEMPPLLERLEAQYRLRPITTLGLPYFALGGGSLPRPARLYEVLPPEP